MKKPISLKIWILFGVGGLLVVGACIGIINVRKSLTQLPPPPAKYVLSSNYTKENILKTFRKLRRDQEYRIYFRLLDNKQASVALKEVLDILLANRSQSELLDAIFEKKKDVSSFGHIFLYLDYSATYVQAGSEKDVVEQFMTDFVAEEFKLTVLGAFYKATYDQRFSFEWERTDAYAAHKLKKLIHQRSLEP